MTTDSAPTFSVGSGEVTTNVGVYGEGHSITTQPDGKILVAGVTYNGSKYVFGIVRYNADGTLDTTFGGTGKIGTPVGTIQDFAYSVTAQPDGKILVAGYTYNGSNDDFGIVRYNNDGSLDTTFNGTGKVSTGFGSTSDVAYGVTVQPDGKIIVAGATGGGFAVVRYNGDGSLDTTFNSTGEVITGFATSSATGRSVTLQSDGKILVAGATYSGTNYDFAIARYNADGSLDTTFNSTGKVSTGIGTSDDFGYSIAVQADGKIVVAGYTTVNNANYDFATVRYNRDGSLDTTFGGTGKVTTAIGSSFDEGQSVVVQPDGKIVVAGFAHLGAHDEFAIVRYNSDGTLDTTFGGSGLVTTAVGAGSDDDAFSITLQPDGKILVAGYNLGNGIGSFQVIRYNSNGSLDRTFNGTNTLDGAPSFTEGGSAVVLDNSVQVYDSELAVSGNYAGASLTLSRHGGASSDDHFSGSGVLGTLTTGGDIIVAGNHIGLVTQNSAGTLSLLFNQGATQTLVNDALCCIAYANAYDAPPSSVQIDWTLSDGNTGAQGTGGAMATTGSTTVAITTVNDAPVATAPSSPYSATEQTTLDLKNTGLSVNDVDGGSGTETVTLSVGEGIINATAGTSGAFVSNSGTASVTITGTIAQINALMATDGTSTLSYYNGSDAPSASTTLSLHINDVGNTGSGGALTADASATIDITAVNDSPALSPGMSLSVNYTEKAAATALLSTGAVSDVDLPANFAGGSFQVLIDSGAVEGDQIVLLNNSGFTINGSTLMQGATAIGTVLTPNTDNFEVVNLTSAATLSVVNSLIKAFGFQSTSENPGNGDRLIVFSFDDGGNTGTGGPLHGNLCFQTVHVTAVNDAPVATAPSSPYSAIEQTTLDLKNTGLSVSDADGGSGVETATLSVSEGVLNASSGDSGATLSGDGTATITITGTIDQINAILSGGGTSTLTYINTADVPSSSVSLTLAIDDNGNMGSGGNLSSSAVATIAVTDVIATPPAPTLAAASDSGFSSADGITNVATPTIAGTAEAGATVTLYDGNTVVGMGVAGTDGSYSIMSSNLSDGTHFLTVTATDSISTVSANSPALSIIIDTLAPDAPAAPTLADGSDTGSSATDGITKSNTPTVAGTAEAGSIVTLYDGMTAVGSAVADSSGNYIVTASTLSDGAHTLTVTATDLAGNSSSASPELDIVIDRTAPAKPAAPALAMGSDSGSSSADRITNVATPTITGTAEAGSTVTLYDGTTVVGTGIADATTGVYTITSSALSDGAHNLKVAARDVAGNGSAMSAALSITIDTQIATPSAPTLVASYDTGSSSSDGITKNTTLAFAGTAEAGSTVTLYDGMTVVGTAVANASGSYQVTSSTLSEGSHTLTTSATDVAGNVSGQSSGITVVIDKTAPAKPAAPTLAAGSDTGSSGHDGITKVLTPTVTGTAEVGSIVTLYDGTTVVGTGVADSGGVYTITSSTLSEGAHALKVQARDAAGNGSTNSGTLNVVIDNTPPAKPAAPTLAAGSDTGTSSSDGLTNLTTPTIRGTTEAGATVTLYDGTTVIGTGVANSNGVYNITSTALTDGQHVLKVGARDAAGNGSANSSGLYITVDTQSPSVAITTPGGDTSTANVTVSGTGEAGTYVRLTDNGSTNLGKVLVADDGTWSKVFHLTGQGSHSLVATDTDKAGNVGSSSAVAFNYSTGGGQGFAAALFEAAFANSGTETTHAVVIPREPPTLTVPPH